MTILEKKEKIKHKIYATSCWAKKNFSHYLHIENWHFIKFTLMSTTFVLNSFSQNSRVCMCLCTKKSKIKNIMIKSSKISIHRFIATTIAVLCGQRMATLIRQYSRMTVKLQELAIKANLGLLWYLQTVAIVK